jgi:tRNA(Ile)-lysidine synthase
MQLGLMAKESQLGLEPNAELVARFRKNLDAVVAPGIPVGLAVSGGPDSLALLLLSVAARPGLIEAATVDHGLRAESRKEAAMVASLCEQLGVPHEILTVEWKQKPKTAIQELARRHRYRLLSKWADDRKLRGVLTAHHLDDQAETFIMRLLRGAGVRGLAGMRPIMKPGAGVAIGRPLLSWRRSELEQVCAAAGVEPAIDPSNEDEQFERVRTRQALAEADWLDPTAVARSAANLAQAEAALQWATDIEWKRAVKAGPAGVTYRPTGAPVDIMRRVVRRAVLRLATEGGGAELRGRELDRLLAALINRKKATLRGVVCVGGNKEWRFAKAPPRKG